MERNETPDEMEAAFEQDAAESEAHRPGERNRELREEARHVVDNARESVERANQRRAKVGGSSSN